MKTGDYTKIFKQKDEKPNDHRDGLKKNIHENRHCPGHDRIHDHKFSMNREQVMDMHERDRNRTHS